MATKLEGGGGCKALETWSLKKNFFFAASLDYTNIHSKSGSGSCIEATGVQVAILSLSVYQLLAAGAGCPRRGRRTSPLSWARPPPSFYSSGNSVHLYYRTIELLLAQYLGPVLVSRVRYHLKIEIAIITFFIHPRA